jgi:hypothetical protein
VGIDIIILGLELILSSGKITRNNIEDRRLALIKTLYKKEAIFPKWN